MQREKVLCALCGAFLRDPRALPCGHFCCAHCIDIEVRCAQSLATLRRRSSCKCSLTCCHCGAVGDAADVPATISKEAEDAVAAVAEMCAEKNRCKADGCHELGSVRCAVCGVLCAAHSKAIHSMLIGHAMKEIVPDSVEEMYRCLEEGDAAVCDLHGEKAKFHCLDCRKDVCLKCVLEGICAGHNWYKDETLEDLRDTGRQYCSDVNGVVGEVLGKTLEERVDALIQEGKEEYKRLHERLEEDERKFVAEMEELKVLYREHEEQTRVAMDFVTQKVHMVNSVIENDACGFSFTERAVGRMEKLKSVSERISNNPDTFNVKIKLEFTDAFPERFVCVHHSVPEIPVVDEEEEIPAPANGGVATGWIPGPDKESILISGSKAQGTGEYGTALFNVCAEGKGRVSGRVCFMTGSVNSIGVIPVQCTDSNYMWKRCNCGFYNAGTGFDRMRQLDLTGVLDVVLDMESKEFRVVASGKEHILTLSEDLLKQAPLTIGVLLWDDNEAVLSEDGVYLEDPAQQSEQSFVGEVATEWLPGPNREDIQIEDDIATAKGAFATALFNVSARKTEKIAGKIRFVSGFINAVGVIPAGCADPRYLWKECKCGFHTGGRGFTYMQEKNLRGDIIAELDLDKNRFVVSSGKEKSVLAVPADLVKSGPLTIGVFMWEGNKCKIFRDYARSPQLDRVSPKTPKTVTPTNWIAGPLASDIDIRGDLARAIGVYATAMFNVSVCGYGRIVGRCKLNGGIINAVGVIPVNCRNKDYLRGESSCGFYNSGLGFNKMKKKSLQGVMDIELDLDRRTFTVVVDKQKDTIAVPDDLLLQGALTVGVFIWGGNECVLLRDEPERNSCKSM